MKTTRTHAPARALRRWILAAAVASVSATAPAHGTVTEWQFRVFLGEREVGEHRFRLEQHADGARLHSHARMNVRLLGVTAFSYTHEAQERWQGDCLERIDAKTDRNGRPYAVSGERIQNAFRVQTLKTSEVLPACVMSFAYWNPKILQQRRLLNPQNGEFVDVSVESKGSETLSARGTATEATRYTLAGRKLRIDLWYTADGRWVGLQSITDGGQLLRYVLL